MKREKWKIIYNTTKDEGHIISEEYRVTEDEQLRKIKKKSY